MICVGDIFYIDPYGTIEIMGYEGNFVEIRTVKGICVLSIKEVEEAKKIAEHNFKRYKHSKLLGENRI